MAEDFAVHAGGVVGERDLVDRADVECRDDGFEADVAEIGDLAALAVWDRAVAAAEQHLRLDADVLEFLDRVLGGLGLELAGARDPGDEREVEEHRALGAEIVAELADGLEEGKALDVADGAADLDEREVVGVGAGDDGVLDGVGDVGDHLDGGAEIVAAAFLRDDVGIDAAGGGVVGAGRVDAGETFVVAEVEIRFGAVVGDEDLAVLVGRHRSGVDVEVGVELAQADGVAAGLEQGGKGRRGDPLAEGRDHAAGDENEPRHGRPVYTGLARSANGARAGRRSRRADVARGQAAGRRPSAAQSAARSPSRAAPPTVPAMPSDRQASPAKSRRSSTGAARAARAGTSPGPA